MPPENVNTYGDISPRTAGFAVADLLERGQHLTVTERFGQTDPQGKNKTKTRKWRRYLSLPRATSPLAEGITPAGSRLNYEDLEVQLEQYGDVVWITDVIKDTHEDPVLKEMVTLCSEQMTETVEIIRIAALKAGSNVYYANAVASRSLVTSPPLRGDLRRIVRGFNRNKCRPIAEIIKASAKISTEPVGTSWFAMCHTDLESDIRGLNGFTPVAQYSDSDKALPGEVGKCESVRFVCTALFESWQAAGTSGTTYLSGGAAVTSSTACDVYPVIVVGRNSYAIVPLQGSNAAEIAAKNPTKQHSDPLGQRGFVSWKRWDACKILNDLWVARYEVACTANPS